MIKFAKDNGDGDSCFLNGSKICMKIFLKSDVDEISAKMIIIPVYIAIF